MSAIITGSIRVDNLPKEKFVKGKNGAVYYNITISVNDESRYGNNVSFQDSQSKEERESKAPKTYLGNGRVVWTDGKIAVAEKEDSKTSSNQKASVISQDDGLPF